MLKPLNAFHYNGNDYLRSNIKIRLGGDSGIADDSE